MIVRGPGPVLADGTLLVTTAEGRIWQLGLDNTWNDFGYPNGSRCLQLANAMIPGTKSATFLTALDGRLYELNTSSGAYLDHGLPPGPPYVPPGFVPEYVAGCVGPPQLDSTVSFPRFMVMTSDGRILQHFLDRASGNWEWSDLGCYNGLPFVRAPVAAANGIVCVASDLSLTLGVPQGSGIRWLAPSPPMTAVSDIGLQESDNSPVGYFVWIVDQSGNLIRCVPTPDQASGQVNWNGIIWPVPIAIAGSPVTDILGGTPVVYIQGSDSSIRALIGVTDPPPASSSAPGASATIYPAGEPRSITPMFVAGAGELGDHVLCFGLNDGSLMLVSVSHANQAGRPVIAATLPSRVAICLSGGGAQGDFEVGAVEYLYLVGIRPHVLCGTSVGAINAAKLAEGGPLFVEGIQALEGLTGVWLALKTNSDFYVPQPWVSSVAGLVEALSGISLAGIEQGFIWSGVQSILNPVGFVLGLIRDITKIVDIGELVAAVANAQINTSIFDLTPTRNLIFGKINPGKIADAGGALYLAMVQLENGQLYWMNQSGDFLSGGNESLHMGVLASASDPVAFPPVKFGDGNNYVDGGVRAVLPLLPAEELDGPTEYFPIMTTAFLPWSINNPGPFGLNIGLANVGLRCVDCAINQTVIDILSPQPNGFPFPGRLSLVASSVQVHDSYTIDPGLIRIAIDYGFMKAADVFAPSYNDATQCSSLAEQITKARMLVWQAEADANGTPLSSVAGPLTGDAGDATKIPPIRKKKQDICSMLASRLRLQGAIPPNIYSDAVLNWERATWQTVALQELPASPWVAYTDTFQNSVPAQSPPDLVTQGRFPGYS